MSFYGLYSGAGGQAIAQELMRREGQAGVQSNPFGDLQKNLPQIMQAGAQMQYYGALQQKAEQEAKSKQVQQAAMQRAMDAIADPRTKALIGAGIIKDQSAVNALQLADQIDSTELMGNEIVGDDPNFAGGDTDPAMIRAMAVASGGDPEKFRTLGENLTKQRDQQIIDNNLELGFNLTNKLSKKLADPRSVELYKAAGIPESAIPTEILSNLLLTDPELQQSPEFRRVLLKQFATGGITQIEKTWYEAEEREYKRQQAQGNVEKTRTESVKNTALARQADATSGLRTEQIDTEKTKQIKNTRLPNSGGSGKGEDGKLNDSQKLSLEKEIRGIDVKIAEEKGRNKNRVNKAAIAALEANKAAAQQKLGIPSTVKPAGYFGSKGAQAIKWLGGG